MAAPTPSQVRFTKGDVNRAGRLLLDFRERVRRDGEERAVAEADLEALDRAWEALTWWRSLHAHPLSLAAVNLRYHVRKADGHVDGRIEVTQRLKRMITLIDKLAREEGNVTQMHDIGGVRAVLPTLRHIYAVRRRLLKSWTIVRVRDYIAEPKIDGYRALHVIVQRRGYPIEVQLRTVAQDVWANIVEEQSRKSGIRFKFGAGSADARSAFVALSDRLARFDRGELTPEELRAALKALP
jgi:GTP pyrophosphokinase